MHVMGWLESGLAMSHVKFGLDAGQAGMRFEYEPPSSDPTADESLIDYIARRKRVRVGTD